MIALVAFLGIASGCGDTKLVAKEHAGDPTPRAWLAEDAIGQVWVASGDVVGEAGTPRCEIGAQFLVATDDGGPDRGEVKDE